MTELLAKWRCPVCASAEDEACDGELAACPRHTPLGEFLEDRYAFEFGTKQGQAITVYLRSYSPAEVRGTQAWFQDLADEAIRVARCEARSRGLELDGTCRSLGKWV